MSYAVFRRFVHLEIIRSKDFCEEETKEGKYIHFRTKNEFIRYVYFIFLSKFERENVVVVVERETVFQRKKKEKKKKEHIA